jgi:hypothetical protein
VGYYDTSYPPSLWTVAVPHITSLAPTTAAIATGSHTITVTGSHFTPTTVAHFGGTAKPTTPIDATHLSFAVDTTSETARVVQVTVSDTEGASNAVPFTLTATAVQESTTKKRGRKSNMSDTPSEEADDNKESEETNAPDVPIVADSDDESA